MNTAGSSGEISTQKTAVEKKKEYIKGKKHIQWTHRKSLSTKQSRDSGEEAQHLLEGFSFYSL